MSFAEFPVASWKVSKVGGAMAECSISSAWMGVVTIPTSDAIGYDSPMGKELQRIPSSPPISFQSAIIQANQYNIKRNLH